MLHQIWNMYVDRNFVFSPLVSHERDRKFINFSMLSVFNFIFFFFTQAFVFCVFTIISATTARDEYEEEEEAYTVVSSTYNCEQQCITFCNIIHKKKKSIAVSNIFLTYGSIPRHRTFFLSRSRRQRKLKQHTSVGVYFFCSHGIESEALSYSSSKGSDISYWMRV